MSHDFAFNFGGAERVTGHLSRMLPGAPVHFIGGVSEIIDRMDLAGPHEVQLPRLRASNYRSWAPVLPFLLGRRTPIEGNLLASSYAFAHLMPATGRTVVYCHSPFRQLWSGLDTYSASLPAPLGAVWRHGLSPLLRASDGRAARRAHAYVATSTAVAQRIRQYYGRPADVIIPPPVDDAFRPQAASRDSGRVSGRFIWVGRIVEPYKRLDLVVETFRDMPDAQLTVYGDGRDRQAVERIAPDNVRFAGDRTTEELAAAYSAADAVIFPSEDDFGMVMTESISCGTPVIAFKGGGALDIVEEGVTGTFFSEPTEPSLREAIRRFQAMDWDTRAIADIGSRYHGAKFESTLRDFICTVE